MKSAAALFAAFGLGVPSAVFGQTISNPSFEATPAFNASPGYISGNTAIPGWTANDNSRAGIRLTAGAPGPFVNNGAIPNGTNAAFLQSGAAGGSTLSTVITGLTPGQLYKVNFRCNARTNTSVALSTPNLRVFVDGTVIVNSGVHAVATSANTTAAWRFFAFDFTAAAATATMTLTNDTATDTTVLVDDFTIAPSTGSWSIAQWTNDLTSGVDSAKAYTHAYNFGSANSPVINGVTFTGVAVGNPSVAGRFASSLPTVFAGPDLNVLTTNGGGSATMAQQFVYNANPETITIFGLVPGAEYVATVYSVGWDATPATRPLTFSVGTDRLTVNQDHYGIEQGIRVSYRYIAPAAGYIVISFAPLIPNPLTTFHTYGFSNYEQNSPPVIGLQPRSAIGAIGNTNYFRVLASGKPPLTYTWSKDGSPLVVPNSPTLVVPVLSASDAGAYSVTVTNLTGTNISSTATLTLGQIANPSFEADLFYGFPGYVGVSAPNPPGFLISGWTASSTNRQGLNPIADGQAPFANTGTIPDGSQAAFLQPTSSLRTTITGLTPGANYTVQFRSNGRNNGTTPRSQLHISVDDLPIVDTIHNPVGGTSPYRFVSFDFTAASTTAVLGLTNDTVADFSVNVDNFTIAPSNSQWSVAIWTNDATAGVDPTKLYTHAYHFGANGTDTTINGVTFRIAAGVNPSVPGFFSTAGFGSTFAGDVNIFNTTGGGSAGMSANFIYGGPVHSITLSNLVPGNEYVASIYSVGFDVKSYGRSATFQVGNDRRTVNVDHFGLDNGIIVSHRYFADANGTVTLTYTPTDAGSTFHTYAFANRVANDSVPVIGAQPIGAFTPSGSTATLTVGLSAGSLPLSYQWYCNGVILADQTNSMLILSNLTTFGTNGYSVIVTNFLGAATSSVAVVEVGRSLSDLFNTGVDNARAFLPGGIVDSHYQLVTSPDPFFPGPDAVTMHNGAFPLLANYFTNGLFSSWISPRTNSSIGNSNGFYVYRTSFIIDTADATHSQIDGRWASDNEGIDIRLNGVSKGISNMVSAPFTTFRPFTITNGFVAGSNIIEFVISNGPATGPTGLRVEMSGVGRPLTAAAPVIVNQPTDRSVVENRNTEFSVVGYGSGPLTYQWFFYGFPLDFGTNRVLRLLNVAGDLAGEYTVTIFNSEGFVDSATAILTVLFPVSIPVQPASRTVECSSNAVFSVTADGTAPFSYQWYFAGSPIVGATGATLTVSNVRPSHAGAYFVAITNVVGGTNSAVATLTVVDTLPPIITCPTNVTVQCDAAVPAANFAGGSVIDGCDPSPVVTFIGDVASGSCPKTILRTYRATDASNNFAECTQTIIVHDTTPPSITCPMDVTVTVDAGLCTASGVLLGTPAVSDNCGVASVTSNAPAEFPAGTTIVTWTVADGCGNQVSCTQRVTVNDRVAPVITTPPASRTNNVGAVASFGVTVASCGPVRYQWCKGTNLIADATNVTLAIANLQIADAGDYLVKVSNFAGSVTSAVAVLTLNQLPVAGDNGVATAQDQAVGLPLIKLLNNDSDPDGDPLTIVSVSAMSTNGGPVVLTSTNVIYTPVTGFAGLDRFSYTISDGRGGLATGSVEVFVASGSLPSANLVNITAVPGGYRIRFAGVPGRSYDIQRATNVNGPWPTLATIVAPLHGIIDFTDNTPPPGSAFYRTIATP